MSVNLYSHCYYSHCYKTGGDRRERGSITSIPRCLYGVTLALLASLLGFVQPALAVEDGQRFQDWTASCQKPAEDQPEVCAIFQIVNGDDDKPILRIEVGYLPANDQPAAILIVPLGVALRPGIGMQIDQGEKVRIPFEVCNQTGCVAGLPLDEKLITGLKKGSRSQITLHDAAGRSGTFEVSLSGFTAGFNALR